MADRLQGKIAIVTGSTQGIGAAVARLFVEEGARVVVNSHALDRHAESIVAELGEDNALFVQADVADAGAMQALADSAVARFGRVDVLVNNAGVDVFSDPLEMTPEQWQRCLSIDLEGAWNAIRAVLPGMLGQGCGSIVNISSVHGGKIIPGCFPYPVAKHALNGLTKALGIEYAARGIRVNSISPGLIMSERVADWLASLSEAERLRQIEILPCRRVGEPREVAYTALFLASDEARFINATDILIDGGRSQIYHD